MFIVNDRKDRINRMSMISHQIEELREIVHSSDPNLYVPKAVRRKIEQAADTIEALSAKLAAANKAERIEWEIKRLKYGFCPSCGSAVGRGAARCFECCEILDWDLLEEDTDRYYDSGWIHINSGLPTKEECARNDGRFIVTDGERVYQSIFDFDNLCFFGCSHFGKRTDRSVLYWMPLPEPCKPKE